MVEKKAEEAGAVFVRRACCCEEGAVTREAEEVIDLAERASGVAMFFGTAADLSAETVVEGSRGICGDGRMTGWGKRERDKMVFSGRFFFSVDCVRGRALHQPRVYPA